MKATQSIFSNAIKHLDGVPLAQVQQAVVLRSQVLRDDQRAKEGRSVTKVEVETAGAQQVWFVATFWYASFDDADDYSYVFPTRELAEAAYNAIYATQALPVPTFMTTYSTPTIPAKLVPGCIIHQGKIAGYTGPGFTPKPYFSSLHVEAAGITRAEIEAAIENRTVWSNAAMVACMIVPGDNGLSVLAEVEPVIVRFAQHHCWETGINFYELKNQLPADLFRSLVQQAGLFHHTEQQEEEGEWKGWASTDADSLTRVITAYGWAANLQ